MCAQDLSSTCGVNAPVAGSLRVQQPYGDRDEGQKMVNKVRTNNSLTRNGVREVTTTSNQWRVDGKPRVDMRVRMTKLRMNVNCHVKCQSHQARDNSSNNDNKLRRLNESAVTVNLIRF